MSTTAQPLSVQNPKLAQEPVAAINAVLGANLDWLTHRYGLVHTGKRKVENRTERFPLLYQQDGTHDHHDIRPTDDVPALSFFERTGESQLIWTDRVNGVGYWLHPLALVVWVYLTKIADRGYDYSDDLVRLTMATAFQSSGEYVVRGLDQRLDQVLSRYDIDPMLLAYPYAGFRIRFEARTEYIEECLDEIPPIQRGLAIGGGGLLRV